MSDKKTKLNHFNASGEAHMVDVADKNITKRRAIVTGSIKMQSQTLEMIINGAHKKGDVLSIARIAGIMASKRTADLIPLCHPLFLTHVEVNLSTDTEKTQVNCEAIVETLGQTGVEMEALTAAQITLLTIYDMCKAVDRGMVITDVCLQSKSGGKSGDWSRG